MIKIEKLHKSYPIGKDSLHVLKGIDLHIKEGEFVSYEITDSQVGQALVRGVKNSHRDEDDVGAERPDHASRPCHCWEQLVVAGSTRDQFW